MRNFDRCGFGYGRCLDSLENPHEEHLAVPENIILLVVAIPFQCRTVALRRETFGMDFPKETRCVRENEFKMF
jgi:hypothetical protein